MADKPIPSAAGSLSPIVFYYFDLNGSGAFCELLEERFRRSGSTRPIVFREWDCYEELPGEDGDLYAYDGIVLSALAAKDLLRPVPEEVSAEGVFPWIMEKSRYRNRNYGVPIMMCSNALICRKKDDQHVRSIMELNETVAIPIRSMLMFYFLQTLCSNRELHRSMKVMEHLLDLLGGSEYLVREGLSRYDGVERFNRGDCRYLLGFTEDIMNCNKDEYTVRFEDFSNSRRRRETLFMVDYVSLGRHIPDEKLQDCLTLMKIMVDEEFTYDVCTSDGRLQYLLPANMRLFPRLAAFDPLYDHLYGMLDAGDNGILRYGRLYYEDFNKQEELLLRLLCEKAGWQLDGAESEEAAPSAFSERRTIRREEARKYLASFCGRRKPASAPPRLPLDGLLR